MRLDAQKQRLEALWNHPDTRKAVRKSLAKQGLLSAQQIADRFECKRRVLRVMNALF